MKEYRQHRFTRPPGATEILLVRHGESRPARPEEPFPLVDGHGDPELSEIGREQAIRVGERLRSAPIDAIYVTNLRRTLETAMPLVGHLGLEPVVEPDLREVHLGEWEGGKLRMMAYNNDPVYQQMQTEERWDVIPGAESFDALNARVMAALSRIATRHPDQLVAAFVHGGIVGHVLAHATGSRAFAFNGADNGSISHIVMLPDRIVVRGFNDRTHLEGAVSDGAMT
ncbi:MAG: histidine phosphatase family protein [Pseudomonadales bacterium]|nr:histidine phosphatase family protein [Pseudomonadales bacterium]